LLYRPTCTSGKQERLGAVFAMNTAVSLPNCFIGKRKTNARGEKMHITGSQAFAID
jgi:hypothetical protein